MLEMRPFLGVSKRVNGLSEPLKNMLHIPGVSVLLTDFKKDSCYFYIKTNIELLCKRMRSYINIEETRGF